MIEIKVILPLLSPIFFIILWCSIIGVLSLFSGWRKLAQHYHFQGDFQGEYIRYQSVRLNRVNYKNILHFGLNERGMYLVPMILFRPFHQPLFIPWDEIIAEPFKRFTYRGYQLQFRSVPGVRLELFQRTFQMITDFLEFYPGRLRLERAD